MDNFNLKKYLAENKLEEDFNVTLDDRPGKFVSSSGRDLQKAKQRCIPWWSRWSFMSHHRC